MSEPALRVANLLVRRASRRSAFELRVEALELQRGSVLAVLGPNGAGKSTLLRTLAGLEEPRQGRIERRVDGPVTMVFQRPIAFSGSVVHNLRVALSGLSLPRGERAARVDEALRHFDIAKLADRRAATLSGGELRRLALARAFALHPAVLLLDEPFDDLDPSGQESLSLDLRTAIASTGVAVAVVTHDLRRALLLSDRIAVLLEGSVAQQGDRERVLSQPTSLEVARLVGMSNLVAGVVRPGSSDSGPGSSDSRPGSSESELELSRVEIDAHHQLRVQTSLPVGTRVWAGMRPERLKVDVGRGEGLPIGKGVVGSVLSDGVAVTVQVAWAGHELRTHLLAGRGLARTIAPGDSVTLSVRPEDVHLIERT